VETSKNRACRMDVRPCSYTQCTVSRKCKLSTRNGDDGAGFLYLQIMSWSSKDYVTVHARVSRVSRKFCINFLILRNKAPNGYANSQIQSEHTGPYEKIMYTKEVYKNYIIQNCIIFLEKKEGSWIHHILLQNIIKINK